MRRCWTGLLLLLSSCTAQSVDEPEITDNEGSSSTGAAAAGASNQGGGSGAPGDYNGTPDASTVPRSPKWVNATGNLAGMPSECSNLGRVAAAPSSERVIAAVALHGLWSSDDNGQSWQSLGTAKGSAAITNRPTSITFDPEHPDVFWETGIYGSGGMYKTTDGGRSFARLGAITNSQGTSVDFADAERKTLITGTHGKGVFRSTDGGGHFLDVGSSLPGVDTLWTLLIDSQTYLLGTYDRAIYRTTDAGASWAEVSALPPSNYDGGFLRASDDAIYLPLTGNTGFGKSMDLGKTWERLDTHGAIFAPPNVRITPIELPDGTLVTLGKEALLRSVDGGAHWQAIGEPFPFALKVGNWGGVTYSTRTKSFFVWHADCGNAVLADAIVTAAFDGVR